MDPIHKFISENLIELLEETLTTPASQPGTRYSDSGKGLFDTLEAISAETASRAPVPGAPTIAAHAEHLRFYAKAYLAFMHGNRERVDWDASWAVQQVSASEWEALRRQTRSELEAMVAEYKAVQTWDDDTLGVALNILAHTAYHLGGIRTLVRVLGQA